MPLPAWLQPQAMVSSLGTSRYVPHQVCQRPWTTAQTPHPQIIGSLRAAADKGCALRLCQNSDSRYVAIVHREGADAAKKRSAHGNCLWHGTCWEGERSSAHFLRLTKSGRQVEKSNA